MMMFWFLFEEVKYMEWAETENGLSEVLNWEKALVLGVRRKADPQQGKDYQQIRGTRTENDQGTKVFCTGKERCHQI